MGIIAWIVLGIAAGLLANMPPIDGWSAVLLVADRVIDGQSGHRMVRR
jgi:hypothetical protein